MEEAILHVSAVHLYVVGELEAALEGAGRDALMEELLPTFIQTTATQFVINREVTIGTQTYRFTPSFFNTSRGQVVAKSWKSTAFETGSIE